MINQILKHMMGGVTAAAKGMQGTVDRISKGQSSRRSAEFQQVGPRKMREAATFSWRLMTNPNSWIGYIGALYDFTAGIPIAAAQGKPVPTMHYSNGGIVVKNSQFFSIYNSTFGGGQTEGVAMGQFAFVPEGASLDTILHEKGHLNQFNNRGGWDLMQWGSRDSRGLERSNDINAGFTHGYSRIFLYLQYAMLIAGNDVEKRRQLTNFLLLRYIYMGFSK
ncbi:hypothetical protein P3G55_20575 [Leptospira sp. 96542]|nr:hypothetical protein [Leptospira sp. 96542]